MIFLRRSPRTEVAWGRPLACFWLAACRLAVLCLAAALLLAAPLRAEPEHGFGVEIGRANRTVEYTGHTDGVAAARGSALLLEFNYAFSLEDGRFTPLIFYYTTSSYHALTIGAETIIASENGIGLGGRYFFPIPDASADAFVGARLGNTIQTVSESGTLFGLTPEDSTRGSVSALTVEGGLEFDHASIYLELLPSREFTYDSELEPSDSRRTLHPNNKVQGWNLKFGYRW